MHKHLNGFKRSYNLWMTEIFENKEVNLHVVALQRKKTSLFFRTRVGKALFGWKETANYQKRKHH